jgi:ribosomal protein L37E
MGSVYYFAHDQRQHIDSVGPFLRQSIAIGSFMLGKYMHEEDAKTCRWVGFGITKGITSPARDTTVLGVPALLQGGMHGDMIAGMPAVDPNPLCYEPAHVLGFADFVRWVYFANPANDTGMLGVDFSIAERATAGVATTMLRLARVASTCMLHGMPGNCELALLNPRMIEPDYFFNYRQTAGLLTVADWSAKGEAMFGEDSQHCPRCGNTSLQPGDVYCSSCGCQMQLVRNSKI